MDMSDFEVVPAGTIAALREWKEARDAWLRGDGVDRFVVAAEALVAAVKKMDESPQL